MKKSQNQNNNNNNKRTISIRTKLLGIFLLTTIIIFAVNLYIYFGINQMLQRIDNIYESNAYLNELQNALSCVQESMTEYLNTKTSDSMGDYFVDEQNYNEMLTALNQKVISNDIDMMEKNIYGMSQSYLELTMDAVEAKWGRNVERYKLLYEETEVMYSYLNAYIYSLNNTRFENNTIQYKKLLDALEYSEKVNVLTLFFVGFLNALLLFMLTSSITEPLKQLADRANHVSDGDLEIALLDNEGNDEVAVLTRAFNEMIVNLKNHIQKLRESLEKENEMKEWELLMEAHLKDAKLKYLQAQINPHFLFNTLNAGAQLAMMEGADKTYQYVQNVADFFRYNVKRDDEPVTLSNEIDLVDNYIYILNVRFSGEIKYRKNIDEDLIKVQVPGMILQPLVENAVSYGIRGIDREGIIELSVQHEGERICVSVRDNGIGIPEEKIKQILEDRLEADREKSDSNGVGLNNVMNRLKLFYKREDVIEITSAGENMGTEVAIFIPVEERENKGGKEDV